MVAVVFCRKKCLFGVPGPLWPWKITETWLFGLSEREPQSGAPTCANLNMTYPLAGFSCFPHQNHHLGWIWEILRIPYYIPTPITPSTKWRCFVFIRSRFPGRRESVIEGLSTWGKWQYSHLAFRLGFSTSFILLVPSKGGPIFRTRGTFSTYQVGEAMKQPKQISVHRYYLYTGCTFPGGGSSAMMAK